MTNKNMVWEFLQFLDSHNGYVTLKTKSVDYKELRDAICGVISEAMNDGYDQRTAEEFFDASVSQIQKDW